MKKLQFMHADDFFLNAQPTTIAEDVRRKVIAEREKNPLDTTAHREMVAWSHLANQLVGAEV
jgi:hypothetical protein